MDPVPSFKYTKSLKPFRLQGLRYGSTWMNVAPWQWPENRQSLQSEAQFCRTAKQAREPLWSRACFVLTLS